jgi:hypothetical protein
MASLRFREKILLEEFLEMDSGYVLNFSDRTFADFSGTLTSRLTILRTLRDIADPRRTGCVASGIVSQTG